MKHPVAAAIAFTFFMIVLLSQVSASTAQVSPLPTVTSSTIASISPLATPLSHWEPSYNPHPKKIKPRAVPFIDGSGEIITKQVVIERNNFDPIVINFKAQAVAVSPLTFESPLSALPYKTYLPLVKQSANGRVLVIAYMPISLGTWTSPTIESRKLITDLAIGTSWHNVSPPGIQFELVGDKVEYSYTTPPTNTNDGTWNLWAIYDQFDICDRVWTEGINEVWIWVDGANGHWYGGEYQVNGPIWSTAQRVQAKTQIRFLPTVASKYSQWGLTIFWEAAWSPTRIA